MGSLKKLFPNTYRDGLPTQGRSSFDNLSTDELQTHLRISRYGRFQLTEAIRPSYDLQVVPREGYRHDHYVDQASGVKVPVLMAAVSRERLLDVFCDLLDPLGAVVDVVLESSHERTRGHLDLYREEVDLPILKSLLYEFEDLLLDDGCTGIAVLNPQIPFEVQFDEHKLLIVYGEDLASFESVFDDYRVEPDDQLRFISEAEHIHSSSEHFGQRFEELKYRLGIES